MPNWYYYDENREKILVTGKQLKELAKNGTITPETFVETHDGKTGLAKHVTGLTFPEPPPIEDEFAQYNRAIEELEQMQSTYKLPPSSPTPILNTFALPIPTSHTISHPALSESLMPIQYEYKSVAAPMIITISSSNPATQAAEEKKTVETFGEIINKECHGGWEFYSMEQITVQNNPGCLGALMGVKSAATIYNMLVFRRPK